MRVLLLSLLLITGCASESKESVSHNRGYVDGCKSKIAVSLSLPEIKSKISDFHYQSGWESGFDDCDGVM
jgi:hypothetical protein